MAVYISLHCGECGLKVANHEQSKRYVHAGMVPEREPHRVNNIKSVKRDESGQEVAA